MLTQLGDLRSDDNLQKAVQTLEESIPNRIICSAPSIAEIVFALGQGERVVGVSDFASYPPEVKEKERIGGYFNPNRERILALKPDLVIIQGVMEKLTAFCKEKAIPILQVDIDDLATAYSAITKIGETLGCKEKAEQLVHDLRKKLNTLRKKAAEIKSTPRVFLCLSRKEGSLANILTTCNSTFLGELVQLAGGKNIFGELNVEYPQISKESLMKRMPEVILEFRPFSSFGTEISTAIIEDWNEMNILPAVSSSRVFLVTEEYMMIPGPRLDQAAQLIFELIHR